MDCIFEIFATHLSWTREIFFYFSYRRYDEALLERTYPTEYIICLLLRRAECELSPQKANSCFTHTAFPKGHTNNRTAIRINQQRIIMEEQKKCEKKPSSIPHHEKDRKDNGHKEDQGEQNEELDNRHGRRPWFQRCMPHLLGEQSHQHPMTEEFWHCFLQRGDYVDF